MAELFEQLLAFKWRDVEFPVTKMTVALAHDLVEHKYWGVDGARIEATGLAPMRFTAVIPFVNGIVPGKNERWSVLYPNAMRELLAACALRTTGILTHPELGEIPCKCERVEFDWSGDRRGGTECQVSWVETKQVADTENPFGPSPVQEIALGALDLDASTEDLAALIPTLPEFPTTFTDLARSIQGVFDTVTLLSNSTAGKINAIVYRVEQLGDSVDRAKSALTWQTTNTIEHMKSDAHQLKENILKNESKFILKFLVHGDTTLAGVTAQLTDAKLADLIHLNPALMKNATVAKGTVIRYYAKS